MSQTGNSGYRLQPGWITGALAVDPSFKKTWPPAGPRDLEYNDILMAPSGSRNWAATLADNGTQFKPSNQKFTVTLRSRSILTFDQGFLNFGASCSASDGSPVFFTQMISNLISRVRVLVGSTVILDQIDKNVFESFNYAFSRAPNYDATIGYSSQGIGTVVDRKSWASGKTYMIPLNLSLLTSEEFIMANNQGLIIEFYLAPATAVVCNDITTSPTAVLDYLITNPRILCHEVIYQPDLQADLLAISPVIYNYVNYKSFTSTIVAGSSTFQYSIPIKVQSLRRIIAFMRPSANVNNPNMVDNLTTDFQYNDCVQYQLRVDNTYYPPQAISAGGSLGPEQAYVECMSCMNKAEIARLDANRNQNNGTHVWKNWDRFVPSIEDFTTNRFAICLDLQTTTDNDPNYLQQFDVTPGNVQLILNINFPSGKPSTNQTLYIFCVHNSNVIADRNGVYTLIE